MAATPEPVPVPPAPDDGLALQAHALTLAHPGSNRPALQRSAFTVAAGERVAVIGPSGAGKSTLLAAAAGELAPADGELRALPSCLLTQRTDLFQDTLRDNLRLADPSADDARLWSVLHAAGLADEVRAMPSALDSRLGEGGLGLSGGQSRRLALARLLLRNAPFWLIDEPTEALDTATARDVLLRLRAHAEGRTLLIATHLRREAALADRLLVLRSGRIVADLRRGSAPFEAALSGLRPD
jgi:ATP-binding cassette subfamily C protein CydC